MAVFMLNHCAFNGCTIKFPTLTDLIEHIEDVHIDLDPAVIEQKENSQPACIPLSYVLRYFTEASKRANQNLPPVPDVRRRIVTAPTVSSVRSDNNTPSTAGSEMDEDDIVSPSEDSNDSWTTVEEYSSEYILRYGVKMNANASSGVLGAVAQEKPFACPVPGCKKRYKNVNGIKYHSKNGHKKDTKVKKAYKCHCGKHYKTAQGLRSHSISNHVVGGSGGAGAGAGPVLAEARGARAPGLVVTAARPLALLDGLDSRLVRVYDALKPDVYRARAPPPGAGELPRVTVQARPAPAGAGELTRVTVKARPAPAGAGELPRVTVQARPPPPLAAGDVPD